MIPNNQWLRAARELLTPAYRKLLDRPVKEGPASGMLETKKILATEPAAVIEPDGTAHDLITRFVFDIGTPYTIARARVLPLKDPLHELCVAEVIYEGTGNRRAMLIYWDRTTNKSYAIAYYEHTSVLEDAIADLASCYWVNPTV